MSRYVHTTFCDDIRQEIGGKLSFIGIYGTTLYAQSFPLTLPKLCLAINVVTPSSHPLRKLVVRVFKDDELLSESQPDQALLTSKDDEMLDMPEDERQNRRMILRLLNVFSPFQIDDPCKLSVRVETEEEEINAIGLKIEQMPEQKS